MIRNFILSCLAFLVLAGIIFYLMGCYEARYDKRLATLAVKEKRTEQEDIELITLELRHQRNVADRANRSRSVYVYHRN